MRQFLRARWPNSPRSPVPILLSATTIHDNPLLPHGTWLLRTIPNHDGPVAARTHRAAGTVNVTKQGMKYCIHRWTIKTAGNPKLKKKTQKHTTDREGTVGINLRKGKKRKVRKKERKNSHTKKHTGGNWQNMKETQGQKKEENKMNRRGTIAEAKHCSRTAVLTFHCGLVEWRRVRRPQ